MSKTIEAHVTEESDGPRIPEVLSQEYLRIRNKEGIVPSKVFYFKYLMPLIRPWLEQRKEHQELRERKYSTLVSLMGFSPETTVHAALILRPRKLIIAYSKDVCDAAEPAIKYLLDEKIITPFNLDTLAIDAFNAVDIYDHILAKLPTSENMVFDITGGTKIMSATAGALAWEKNLSLCYLNGSWDPQRGAAGLKDASQLIVFSNPSRSRGYRYRREALRNYCRGNFIAAAEGFNESVKLIDDSYFDQLGIQLCCCYNALADFDREGMPERIHKLKETLSFGGVRKLYQDRMDFEPHVNALQRFAKEPMDLMAVSAAFMELADLYVTQRRYDLAGLLSYRSMERFVEIGLQERAPKFKMNDPDWKLLTEDESHLRMEYAKLWRNRNDPLPSKVGFTAGFAILSILDETLGERFCKKSSQNAVNIITGLAAKRNRSYLAHGVRNLSERDSLTLRRGAKDLAKAILKEEHDEFELLRSQLRPIELHRLWDDA